MKKLVYFIFIIPMITNCDPVSVMDANISNSTSQILTLTFVSSSSSVVSTETLTIDPNQTILFREGMSTTGGFLEPSFVEYDSIYVESESKQILKVYKQSVEGKNIYNVDKYWKFTKPSKRYYKYDYHINDEDFK